MLFIRDCNDASVIVLNISFICKTSSRNNEDNSINSNLRENKTHCITRGTRYYSKRLRNIKFGAMANEFELQLKDILTYSIVSFENRLGLLVNVKWSRPQKNKLERRIMMLTYMLHLQPFKELSIIEDRKLNKAYIVRYSKCKFIDDKFKIIFSYFRIFIYKNTQIVRIIIKRNQLPH